MTYRDTNCMTGDSAAPAVTQVYYVGDGGPPTWQSSYQWSFITAADAQSANCSIGAGYYGGNTAFDEIYLALPDPIFANGFDS
ncbi:hypothetical protein GCM10009105_20490 [Dokdonella soli]|uniref:Uncharacterized protein n=2 Tax=Dokdonella soli TaxID=529810 RepID=A0ABP3TPY4_9GAMM